jgi:hypothetical protein
MMYSDLETRREMLRDFTAFVRAGVAAWPHQASDR